MMGSRPIPPVAARYTGARPWTWYGWSIWGGERYRWFVYATFGHSAAALDSAAAPAEDERDNVRNVAPHVEYVENALYEFLPGLAATRSGLQSETLSFRMVAGGATPRYVRLRPRPSLSAVLVGSSEQALPDAVRRLVAKSIVEIWTLRPTMSLGLALPTRP